VFEKRFAERLQPTPGANQNRHEGGGEKAQRRAEFGCSLAPIRLHRLSFALHRKMHREEAPSPPD
jgi:hypothetical protein